MNVNTDELGTRFLSLPDDTPDADRQALRYFDGIEKAARGVSSCGFGPDAGLRIVVRGGGTGRPDFVWALLLSGSNVVVLEADADDVQRGIAAIRRVARDDGSEATVIDGVLSRLEVTHACDSQRDVFAAIDVSAAEPSQAYAGLREMVDLVPAQTAIAVMMPSFDPDELPAELGDPARFVGIHVMGNVIEFIHGDVTPDAVVAVCYALARRFGRVAVFARKGTNSIMTRLLARYREAADTVFMDGSTPWEVDEALVAFGFAMGPYEAEDLIGLEHAHAERRRLDAQRDPQRRYIPIADRMIELGKLGKKTGAGWYRYPGGGGKVDDPIVADLAIEEAHFAGTTRTDYRPDEILERVLLALINEAADLLDGGFAGSAADIELTSVLGLGFPRRRGGLLYFADAWGVQHIVSRLRVLAEEDPVVWRISPLLLRCCETGKLLAASAN